MDFKQNLILAPMAGVTDYAFRKIARQFGEPHNSKLKSKKRENNSVINRVTLSSVFIASFAFV